MNIKKYDNKLIRLQTILDEVFEGVCTYNDVDYTEFVYGEAEESLKISCFLFYKSAIKRIEIIKEYSAQYDYLEELTVEEIDLIEEVFDSEDNDEIYRVLLCIKDKQLPIEKDLERLLNNLIKYNEEQRVLNLAKQILNREY